MRYEKPVAMDLKARARASGQGPLGCVSGPAAGYWESCGNGDGAGWGCTAGGSAGGYVSCMPGGAAGGGGDCLSGTVVAYYCEAGALGEDDPNGCQAGPSYS